MVFAEAPKGAAQPVWYPGSHLSSLTYKKDLLAVHLSGLAPETG